MAVPSREALRPSPSTRAMIALMLCHFLLLGVELLSTGAREGVVLRATVVLGDPPLAVIQPLSSIR